MYHIELLMFYGLKDKVISLRVALSLKNKNKKTNLFNYDDLDKLYFILCRYWYLV